MVKTETNPGGLPKDVFDGFQAQLAVNRSEFYRAIAAGPHLIDDAQNAALERAVLAPRRRDEPVDRACVAGVDDLHPSPPYLPIPPYRTILFNGYSTMP